MENEKNTVEAVEANYDGTLDEEYTEEVEENSAADDTDTADDEDYFDLDEDEAEKEADEPDDDGDADPEDEESGEESDEDESADEHTEEAPEKTENSALEGAVRNLLDALDIKNPSDLVGEIEKLTAESLGVSPEEYEQRKARAAAWEAQMQRDIDAIHEAYPATKKYKSLKELPNKEKFGKLMDDPGLNLTVVEAFAATHPDIVKAHNRSPGKKSDLKGTKDHIKSSVPKGAKDTSTFISKSEMEAYREMFPDLSKEDIKKLYKSASK